LHVRTKSRISESEMENTRKLTPEPEDIRLGRPKENKDGKVRPDNNEERGCGGWGEKRKGSDKEDDVIERETGRIGNLEEVGGSPTIGKKNWV